MKGVIFNLLERFLVEVSSEDTVDEIYDECEFTSNEPFVGPKTYPDEDFFEMVGKACSKLGIPMEKAQRALGEWAFDKLISASPTFVKDGMTLKEFICSVDRIIHVEVRKLYPGAITPEFKYHDTGPNTLDIEYRSSRNLCFFMEGLLNGSGKFFDKQLTFEQVTCVHRGDEVCTFQLVFDEEKPWQKIN